MQSRIDKMSCCKKRKRLLFRTTQIYWSLKNLSKKKKKVKWIKVGDKKTHKSIKAHRSRNKILRLQGEQDTMVEDYDMVKNLATDFFENLFRERNQNLISNHNWKRKTLTQTKLALFKYL